MLWETDYDRVDTSKPRSMKIYNKLGKYWQLINNRKPIKWTRMEFLWSKLSNKYMNIFQKFINEINTDMKSSEEQNQVEVSQEIQQGTSHNEEIEYDLKFLIFDFKICISMTSLNFKSSAFNQRNFYVYQAQLNIIFS